LPVILLTARGEESDRIVGLELGADDYVTKPFDLRELLARVRSVLRRTAASETLISDSTANFRFAGFRLSTGARTLTGPEGNEVRLTTGEYDLLCVFVAHPDRVLSRDDLMSHLHGRDAGPYDRAIDVGVGRLRRKLADDAAKPALIKAVRGAGYLFSARVERE
ncbi:MAG: winged helix-turn-helix domain-containing protein, partial [Rudaea sp.]